MLDEIRFWPGVRSADEIRSNWRLTIEADSDAQPNLYWRLNDEPTTCVADSSKLCVYDHGSGEHQGGMIASIPRLEQTMYFTDVGLTRLPTMPRRYPSKAPVVSKGDPVVATLTGNGTQIIELPAHDPLSRNLTTSLTNEPRHGFVYDVSGALLSVGATIVDPDRVGRAGVRVVYVSAAGAAEGEVVGTADNFTYTVAANEGGSGGASGSAPVLILPFEIPTPSDLEFEMDEDVMLSIPLAIPDWALSMWEVVISAIPPRGRLYHAAFKTNFDEYVKNLVADNRGDEAANLVQIEESGTAVDNLRGLVQFWPLTGARRRTRACVRVCVCVCAWGQHCHHRRRRRRRRRRRCRRRPPPADAVAVNTTITAHRSPLPPPPPPLPPSSASSSASSLASSLAAAPPPPTSCISSSWIYALTLISTSARRVRIGALHNLSICVPRPGFRSHVA